MTLKTITAQEFSKDLREAINERDPSLDTAIGPINNLFVTPFARVCERQSNRAVYLSNLSSLKYVDKLRVADVDDLVYNEGMVRWSGSQIITTVTFARSQPPVSDILVPLNTPLATKTDPQTGQSVIFRTVEAKTMYASAASSYYNVDTGQYELTVAVASVTTGDGNSVGANTIVVMRRPIPGFESVFNVEATSVGKGVETNVELAERYLLHVKGSQLATPAGAARSLRDNFNSVEDEYLVYGKDEALEREREDAGAVDVWVKGANILSATYTQVFQGLYVPIVVVNQPLSSIIDITDGTTHFVQGTDYEVIQGEGIYAWSNRASDGIRFLPTGSYPVVGASLTITYKYNALMGVLNAYYTQPEYYVMGENKLYRWSQPANILIDVSLKINAGNPDTVAKNVRTAITKYVNGLNLGQNVEEFDIDRTVGQLYGVDNLVWNQLSFEGETGVSDLVIEPKSYAFLPVGSLNVSLL